MGNLLKNGTFEGDAGNWECWCKNIKAYEDSEYSCTGRWYLAANTALPDPNRPMSIFQDVKVSHPAVFSHHGLRFRIKVRSHHGHIPGGSIAIWRLSGKIEWTSGKGEKAFDSSKPTDLLHGAGITIPGGGITTHLRKELGELHLAETKYHPTQDRWSDVETSIPQPKEEVKLSIDEFEIVYRFVAYWEEAPPGQRDSICFCDATATII